MKLYYNDLSSTTLQKLIINSLEHALYQAIVVIDGEEHIVWKNDKETLTTRSLVKMREHFEDFDVSDIVLRQESAYDEMIGLNTGSGNNRMEVPLGKKPYPPEFP